MLIRLATLCALLLALTSARAADDAAALAQVRKIGAEVAALCESRGLLACEPHFRGMDPVFDLLRETRDLARTEKEFDAFVKRRFAGQGLDSPLAEVSLEPEFKIELVPALAKAHDVKRISGGYDFTNDKGELIALRRDDAGWFFTGPKLEGFGLAMLERQLQAVQLKKRVLAYRMLECELAQLDKATLEANINRDVGPIVAEVKPIKVTAAMSAGLRPFDEVLAYYEPLRSPDDMKRRIRAEHGLPPR